MPYYRKAIFYDETDAVLNSCTANSWNHFLTAFCEILFNPGGTIARLEYYADETADPTTLLSSTNTLLVGGLFFELFSGGSFVFPEFAVDTDIPTLIRNLFGFEKVILKNKIWKTPAFRDIHRIIHKGK